MVRTMKSGNPIKIIPESVPSTECIYVKHGSTVGIKALYKQCHLNFDEHINVRLDLG